MVCGELGIGGGEYRGDSDTKLGRINLFYHEASDGKHFLFPRGAHGPLARRDRRCSPKSPLGKLLSQKNLVENTNRQKLGQEHFKKVERRFF